MFHLFFYYDTLWKFTSFFVGFSLMIVTILYASSWSKNVQLYWNRRRRMLKLAESLPGLPTLSFLGNILELWDVERAVETFAKISLKLNASTYGFWLGPILKVIVTDPRDLEIILTNGATADKDDVYTLAEPCITGGIFVGSGPTVRAHKKIITPLLNNNKILGKYCKSFNHHAQIFLKILETKVEKGDFDINDDVMHCIGDIVFETLLGLPPTSQLGEISPILDIMTVMPSITFHRIMRPWLYPSFIFYRSKIGRKYLKNTEIAHNIIDNEIEKRRKKWEIKSNNAESEEKLKSVCDFILEQLFETEMWSPQEIRSEALTLFLGSQDTLEGVCCFVILMIAMHPKVQEKAREEINNILINDEINESEISNLKYLDLIIKETMRLFPVGPLLPRKVTKDLKLSSCTIPEGCSVFMLPFLTHRDAKYWDEPQKFIPERFYPENSKNRHSYAFVPFSSGLRSCPGSKYGMICLKIILANVIRSYKLQTAMKLEGLQIYTHISTRSVNGYKISLTKI